MAGRNVRVRCLLRVDLESGGDRYVMFRNANWLGC